MIWVEEYNKHNHQVSESSLEHMHFHNTKLVVCSEPSDKEYQELSAKMKLPKEIIVQGADHHERPRLNNIPNHTQIILKAPVHKKDKLRTYSFTLYISERMLLIVSHHQINAVENFKQLSPEVKKAYYQKGTTWLLYELCERIMDDYFKEHEAMAESINYLEEQIIGSGKKEKLREIFKLKTSLIYFSKALAANRDVIVGIEKGLAEHADKKILPQFRLVYNDVIQLIDVVSTDREIVSGAVEIYMTRVSNNLNQSMKKITAWGSLILIPTFITGLYGMNFHVMPEIAWQYGYPFALSLMALSVIVMAIFFKKKGHL